MNMNHKDLSNNGSSLVNCTLSVCRTSVRDSWTIFLDRYRHTTLYIYSKEKKENEKNKCDNAASKNDGVNS